MDLKKARHLGSTSGNDKSCIIFLHGYGASGDDLISLAPYFAQHLPDTVFLSPDAPDQCPMNPSGFQWFPIPWMDGSSQEQMISAFMQNVKALETFISDVCVHYNIHEDKIILAGFSQGAMMSMHIALRHTPTFAGVLAFSGRLLFPEHLSSELRERPEIVLIHGDQDDVVSCEETHLAYEHLQKHSVPVYKHISPGLAHSIAPDGLQVAITSAHKWIA